ncbi:MAG: hypothetical protein H8E41_05115 [Desulfobulbaceae bacterium]|uniref:Cytochrome c7-like domain-containing protein n=1 Tax=Candidatus Desulfobia pelagia TaxID=2841692 RepID=A0A8J6NE90_9BACT|nr:hypothetical protein [Candidatus Desulfobia pelagia]
MIKSPLFTIGSITLSAYLFLVGSSLASEAYDADTYGPENPLVWEKTNKVVFSHKVHTMDAEIECSSCHDDLFGMESGTDMNSDKVTMKAMEEGQFCGACHDGDTAFGVNTNCQACHVLPDDPLIWDSPGKAVFSHTAHVEEFGFECATCHSEIFSMKKGTALANKDFTMASLKEGKYCGICHDGDSAFNVVSQCESCHFPPTEKIIFTQPVKAVIFDHDIHLKKGKLSCVSCHKDVFVMKKGSFEGQQLIQSENPAEKRKYLEDLHNKYCGTCHNSSQAFGYLTRCTVCHVGVKGLEQKTGGDKKEDAHGKAQH